MTEQEMLRRMAAYCTAAERCSREVEKKINAAGLSADVAERILVRLGEERFLDDRRYAACFVRDKLRFNKWGRVKIAYELHKKGILPELRKEALEQIDENEYRAILLKLLKEKKKTTRGKDERDRFAKLLRFAAGRGFEGGEAVDCLKQLFNGENYELEEMEGNDPGELA